jgi:asparagine synthase (glutamine-hydrolysing)
MFQYVALSWNAGAQEQAAAALRLSRALQASSTWQPALLGAQLHVFVAGCRPDINGVYPLSPHDGVVLGKLFRRGEPSIGTKGLELTDQEVERIVRTTGQELVDGFWGRYVAFLPDPSRVDQGVNHVLRDPSGALPCYRLHHDGVEIACSWLDGALKALPELQVPAVDWDGLTAQLLLGRLGGTTTALEGVHHVAPGLLTPLAAGVGTILWDAIDFARSPIDEPPELAAERLRHTVRLCARSWANCYDDVLLRLSGGLDSAILLSCLRPSTPDMPNAAPRVACLNYHSPGSDSDERPYARCVADHMGMPLIEKECDPTYDLLRVLDVALTPAPESYVGRLSMAHMDAQMAARLGASVLFTGGGGDQLFFEHRCALPAGDYLRNRGLDGGFAAAVQDAARLGRVSVWTAAGRAIAGRCGKLNGIDCYRPKLASDPLNLEQPENYLHPSLRAARTLAQGKYLQVQQLLCPLGYYDPYLQAAAPELLNPLLSQPLIELCLALPTYLLTHGGRGRALARRAFADDLPAQITHRRSKGGMEEHLTAVLRRNLAFVRDLLLDGQLVARRMVDRDRLESALSDRPSMLGAHVSEIHGYVAIEAWLQRRASMQSGSSR